MNNSAVSSIANLGSDCSASQGRLKSKTISSIPLLACFYAYSHIPMSIWLQFLVAYSLRICLLWTMLSLLLLAFRHIDQSVVSFLTELYTATFYTTIGVFGIVYFPLFTITFVSLCAISLGLKILVQPVKPASPKASTIKIKKSN